MPTDWPNRYSHRSTRLKSSVIRELLKLTRRPEVISFAGGMPAPELFPLERFEQASRRVILEQGQKSLQYAETEGWPDLRAMIARHATRYGIPAAPANVLITTGSQQALDLIGKLMIDPGDKVVVEAPTYLGGIQAFNAYGPEYIQIPTDEHGLQIEPLEQALKLQPKFMYVLPNFQNPSGVTLSMKRRQRLIQLVKQYGVPVVEDDPYGQLRYDGEHLPPLFALDRENWPHPEEFRGTNVLYLSTFSKTLAPGLRIGWIVGPSEVLAKLTQLKQGTDLHTSTLTQAVAYEVARGGFLDEHVQTLRRVYRERRDVMLQAMAEFFPEGTTWTRPLGGLFLWARLPEGLSSTSLLEEALKCDVAFVPGTAFYPNEPDGEPYMRLNFSNMQPEAIREGIRRLGDCIRDQIKAPLTPARVDA